MDERQITENDDLMKSVESLSEEDLCSVSSGGLTPKTKEVLKWIGVGVGSASAITVAGIIGIAVIAGKKNYGNPLHYLGNTEMDRRLK